MVRTRQQGSILEFVIIGSVMALLLIGGAYLVRNTLTSAGQSDDSGSTQTEGGAGDTEQEKNAARNGEAPEEKPEASSEEKPESTQAQEDQDGQSETATPANLPQTGPADTLVGGFLLGGIVAAATAYKRSRGL